ncbi:MAG: FAD-dependent oxidoreductase [Patescibacteria group bacterium]
MQKYLISLNEKVRLSESVFLFRFRLVNPRELLFVPGQYVVFTIPYNNASVKRLYSIASSSANTDAFELLIKIVPNGIASNHLSLLTIGQTLEVEGPAGVFGVKETGHDKVFLATGTGIAPIRSFYLSHLQHTRQYRLFWGLPTLKDLYLFDELKQIALKDPLFCFCICLSKETDLSGIQQDDRKYFSLGHIDGAMHEKILCAGQSSLEYYICGRREVVESTRLFLYNQNIDRSLVYFERY